MPLPAEYKPLVADLIRATSEGRVAWRPDSPVGTYSVQEGDSGFSIFHYTEESLEEGISLMLRDQHKVVLDIAAVPVDDADYGEMEMLYEGAKRVALRIDDRLAAIRTRLNKGKSFGSPPPSGTEG